MATGARGEFLVLSRESLVLSLWWCLRHTKFILKKGGIRGFWSGFCLTKVVFYGMTLKSEKSKMQPRINTNFHEEKRKQLKVKKEKIEPLIDTNVKSKKLCHLSSLKATTRQAEEKEGEREKRGN